MVLNAGAVANKASFCLFLLMFCSVHHWLCMFCITLLCCQSTFFNGNCVERGLIKHSIRAISGSGYTRQERGISYLYSSRAALANNIYQINDLTSVFVCPRRKEENVLVSYYSKLPFCLWKRLTVPSMGDIHQFYYSPDKAMIHGSCAI